MNTKLTLTGKDLSLEDVFEVACNNQKVADLTPDQELFLKKGQTWLEDAITKYGKIFYGINTGFGALAAEAISPSDAARLSRNTILADAASVGAPIDEKFVRGMMLIRANSLMKGVSAVRPVIVQTLIEMLNKGVIPYIPSKGSVGASGDLSPLSHMAVVFTQDISGGGESGQAWYKGELLSGEEAMKRAGIFRIAPKAKEGCALVNGTTFMASLGSLAVIEAEKLFRLATIASALSFEGLLALTDAFHPGLHTVSNQYGQPKVAADILKLLDGSQLVNTSGKRQDAYTVRCVPQILGPLYDAIQVCRSHFEKTINAATDNPLIIMNPNAGQEEHDEFLCLSGGNFHGEGPAVNLDFLSIAVAEIASVAERRVFRLLTPELNNGMPSMLVPPSNGLNTGLMVSQYTAAALVSDNKTLAHPDSVDSIPTSANQEDHVSMGANAARHLWEILENVKNVIAIELFCAEQAVYIRGGEDKLGKGTKAVYDIIRSQVTPSIDDRMLSPDINTIAGLMDDNSILDAVDKVISWS